MKKWLERMFYIIIILVIALVIYLLLIANHKTPKELIVNFYVSGNFKNVGCVSVYVDDYLEGNQYSFDGGENWQKSRYGAIYQNGITKILVRDHYKNIILEKEVNIKEIVSSAPIIYLDFDTGVNKLNNDELLEGVMALDNGIDISSEIKIDVLEIKDKEVLVSYLVEKNGKKSFLLRKLVVKDTTEYYERLKKEEENNQKRIEEGQKKQEEKEDNDNKELLSNDGWVWPTNTPYNISRGYAWYNGKMHKGIDIYGTGRGSPIYAAREGEVVDITSNSSSGYYVILKHDNGYYTRYAHLQNTKGNDKLGLICSATKYISVGQKVKAKDIIGEMGSSGGSTGVHLHFEIWDGEPFSSQSFNPLLFYKNR